MAPSKKTQDHIRYLRRRVQDKLYRIRKNNPDILTDKINPNLPLGSENNMSPREIRNYVRSMENFINRRNQYVSGAKGTPISKNLWNLYKKAESRANSALEKQNSVFKKIIGPQGISLSEFMESRKPQHPQMLNEAANAYYFPLDRTPASFQSEDKLEQAINAMLERAQPNFLSDKIPQYRNTLEIMAERSGDDEIYELTSNLTDQQLDLLWRATDFMKGLSLVYENYKDRLNSKKSMVPSEAIEKTLDSVYEAIEWASKQYT